jgi:sugar lactone lactonase YvrE
MRDRREASGEQGKVRAGRPPLWGWVTALALCVASMSCRPMVRPGGAEGGPEVVYEWVSLEYELPAESAARAAYDEAVSRRTALAGVELDRRGDVYVTTPRWLDARVPSTLNRVVKVGGRALLRPFPSLEANSVADPRAFQNVLGVEVDSRNRMWVLDMGWVAGRDDTPEAAQKLVVLDLEDGRELARYVIPDSVADRRTSFLNDLAVDEGRGVAYLSDSGNRSGSPTASGIIIYDLATNTARRVLDRDASVRDDPSRPLFVHGEPALPGQALAVGVNGIALSPDGRTLFWSLTTGDAVYSAPTEVLRAPGASAAQRSAAVSAPRRIEGGSDGLTVDDRGRVYVTNVTHDRVEVLDGESRRTLASGPELVWPDSLSWDDRGGLYVSTNHLNHLFSGRMTFTGPRANFRILRVQTDARGKGFVR